MIVSKNVALIISVSLNDSYINVYLNTVLAQIHTFANILLFVLIIKMHSINNLKLIQTIYQINIKWLIMVEFSFMNVLPFLKPISLMDFIGKFSKVSTSHFINQTSTNRLNMKK